jgi:hypothetical protein
VIVFIGLVYCGYVSQSPDRCKASRRLARLL